MFDHCHTLQELKTEYRRLALEFHPDKGGNKDEFIKIHLAMKQRLKELSGNSAFRFPDFLPEEVSRKIVNLGFELLDDAIVSLKEKISNRLFDRRN
ncbi:hypothetical protein BY457_11122 [Marinilabilia salmonicolor]|jgi:curved DNA-binding protein CbpA|uniref:hypothetical protein n=1 Tax=Marinilabilia salmonicolor TaxID=989 RepID=UPI000D05AE94|nr:hypothetical protein [Marinilabilia salmonicolor]PRY97742.1 hypothetical protein BY457_11122 [Marinilabilia salmonicolor]